MRSSKKKCLEVNPSDLSKHLFLSWRQNLSPFMQLLAQFYSFFPKVSMTDYTFFKAVYTNYLLFLLFKKKLFLVASSSLYFVFHNCNVCLNGFITMQVSWSSWSSWSKAREPCLLCICTSSDAQLMTKSFNKLIVNSLYRYMNINVGTTKAVRGISPQNSRKNTKQLPLNCICWKPQNAVIVTSLTLANYLWLGQHECRSCTKSV